MPKGQPVLDNDYAPYAPYKAVHDVIIRYREAGLPDPLTPANLESVGVATGMTARTLRALRFLGLVDEEGGRLEPFQRLKRATTEEYPSQLAEIVRAAYVAVFAIVDPATHGDTAVADAFRRFEPSAQRGKMIALFRSLCEEAGIIKGGTSTRQPVRRPSDAQKAKPNPATTPKRQSEPEQQQEHQEEDQAPDYRLISAVIQRLPRDGKWTPDKRDRWLQALTSAVDLLIEVEAEAE
ncbi:MAG: DUF5343 domain-containing protein [Candidatus Limnocylindrales bacterium]|jgi:hypothetical protein